MRIFALSALLTLVGVLAQPSLPATGVLAMLASVLVAMAFRWPVTRAAIAGAVLAVFALAIAMSEFSSSQLHSTQISVDTRLRIKVAGVPTQDSRRLRFTADVIDCLSCELPWGPGHIQLSWYGGAPTVRAGEIWEVTARVKPVMGLRNPGGFDLIRWSLAKGLQARGYIRQKPMSYRLHEAKRSDLAAMRERWSNQLVQTESANERIGLVQALTLGIKDRVDTTTWTLLRDTGTSHLLAISGLHISLLAGWGYLMGRQATRLMRRLCTKVPSVNQIDAHRAGLLSSIVIALAYALMAGFELPVQRALMMLLVWVVCSWCCRILPPASGLAIAMLVVLMHNILSTLSVGFWLSFGTVAALFFLHHGHQRQSSPLRTRGESATENFLMPQWQRYAIVCSSAARTHVLLGLVLLPLSAWFFQSGSLSAPLANLLAVPWVGFVVVPLCFASVLTSQFIPDLAVVLLTLAQWSLDLLLTGLSWVSGVFDGAISLSIPGPAAMFVCLFGLLVAFTPKGLGIRWLAIPLIMPVLLFNVWRTPVEGFQVHVLDVGQGLATLVYSSDYTLLFDTGGKVSANLSQFEAVVMPFLHASGRRRIDTLVVSHGDEDHAFGVADVVRRFPDVRVLSSVNLTTAGDVPVALCEAGMSWKSGAITFGFLHPAVHDIGSDNDRSCVLLVHHGASRALLTGDIEHDGERALVQRTTLLPVDLLVAPHHGSKTSSGPDFIELFKPRHVVFPAGFGNAYGFPHADVQLRYKLSGAKLYQTGQQGAMSFAFTMTGLSGEPNTWWNSHRRFWHGIVNPACLEQFKDQALLLRLLRLAQKGKTLCGK